MRAKPLTYSSQCPIQIRLDQLTRYSNYSQSQRFQQLLSLPIGLLLRFMNSPIHLDNQSLSTTKEINDESTNWLLAFKFPFV